MRTRIVLAGAVVATLAFSACGSSGDESSHGDAGTTPSPTTAAPTAGPAASGPSPTPVNRTPELDAIGAIGHSGATGADSTGNGQDAPENSWITGTNPKVDSIYLRLLADHPALEGHAWNDAVSGSSATDLMSQAKALLTHDPVPDIVFIVSIDNDMLCDGTDEQNLDPYEATVAEVVDFLQQSAPGLKVYFNKTPFSVHQYDAALMTMAGGPEHIDWPGSPCDPLADDGTIDPAGEAAQQQVFDDYFARLQDICDQREGCATDGGALQSEEFTASSDDFTEDLNHLTVSGLAREAAVVWDTLPSAWR